MRNVGIAMTIACALGSAAPARPADAVGRAEFTAVVQHLAAEADAVDRVWGAFKATCGVRVVVPLGYGREWFALWGRGALPVPGSSLCMQMLSGVLERGEAVRRDLIQIRGQARRAMIPRATEVGMLRWNGLDWEQ